MPKDEDDERVNNINHSGISLGDIVQNRDINIGPVSDRIEENRTR